LIPIGGDNRGRRISPLINLSLIAANLAVFIYQITMPLADLERFVYEYGAIPAELVPALQNPGSEQLPVYATVFTSMFMHGGLLHFLGNMLFLWVFGDNIEDALGHFNYLLFYLLGGVGAVAAQVLVNPESTVPMVGASGAISAVMGAYLLLFPTGTIRVLVFIGLPFIFLVPALLMLGLWFLLQFLSGIAALEGASDAAGGIAFWAHIGGFVAGAVMVWIFRDPAAVQRQRAARSGRRAFHRG
jgi:membrane associated rhomboid family serine protease